MTLGRGNSFYLFLFLVFNTFFLLFLFFFAALFLVMSLKILLFLTPPSPC
jgi:hypothetical protein